MIPTYRRAGELAFRRLNPQVLWSLSSWQSSPRVIPSSGRSSRDPSSSSSATMISPLVNSNNRVCWFSKKAGLSIRAKDGLLTVAILGPANAGKSTLFNRFMCRTLNKSYRLSSDKNRRKTVSKVSPNENFDRIFMS